MTSTPDSTLAALANGRLLSVWTSDSNTISGQISSGRNPGIGQVFSVAPARGATVSHLSATELSDGRFVVVWEETDGSGKHTIQARLFGRDTVPISNIFEVGASAGNRTFPNVIADGLGGFSVIATDGASVTRISVNAVGVQSAPKVLLDEGLNPSVALLRDGSVITVAAMVADGGGYEIAGVVESPNGQITVSKVLASRNEPVPPHPTVTGLSSGEFVLAWAGQVNGASSAIFQAYTANGSIAGSAAFFNPPSAGQTFFYPIIQSLPGGKFAYAAMIGSAGNTDIYLGSDSSTSAMNDMIQVDATAIGNQFDPSLAVLRDGRHVLTWIQQGSSGDLLKFHILDERTNAVSVTGTEASDDYLGTRYDDTLIGGAGDDYLDGNSGSDILDGGTGVDTMVGGDDFYSRNNTTYFVDNVLDQCIETWSGGTDRIVTSVNWTLGNHIENLTAAGSDSLALRGNSLANIIVGNSGSNRIKGEAGNDTLSGGEGSDAFVFATKPNKKTNLDKITDFNVKADSIWLDNKVFTKLGKKGSEASPAKLNKAFFKIADKAQDKNDYLIYNKKSGILSYDADGSGGKYKAVEIASLKKGLKMTAADFFVV